MVIDFIKLNDLEQGDGNMEDEQSTSERGTVCFSQTHVFSYDEFNKFDKDRELFESKLSQKVSGLDDSMKKLARYKIQSLSNDEKSLLFEIYNISCNLKDNLLRGSEPLKLGN